MKNRLSGLSLIIIAAAALLPSCAGNPPPIAAPAVPRVVLVHGFIDDGKTFKPLKQRLEKRGFEVYIPKLLHIDGRGGLDLLAEHLKQDIDTRFGPDAPLSIVSFSMGGIVSRYYLQELGGADRCRNFITISSPHNGTKAAWAYPSRGAIQMRPGSPFLSELAASQGKLRDIPVTSYRTPMDLIILPPTSSVWDRAENLEYPVIAHPLMLTSNPVLNDIERRLEK
jgi:triacylglycerol lipase